MRGAVAKRAQLHCSLLPYYRDAALHHCLAQGRGGRGKGSSSEAAIQVEGGQDLPGLLHSRTLSQWHTMHRPRFSSRALGIHGLWSMGYSKEPFWFIEAAGP